MAVFRMEGYETTAEVLSDGTLNLPRLGSVPVWGLSLDEARRRITAGYATILRRPIVYLDLVEARPVRVSVSGEVQRPGLYSIGKGGSNQLSSSGPGSSPSTVIQTSGAPTLLDAIQRAGGLTAYGDLRRLTVQRPSGGPGSPVRVYQFDFLKVLSGSGPVTNPLLYDGDSISIPREELIGCQQRAAILTNEKFKGVRCVVGDGSLKISCTNTDQEEAQEEAEIEYSGDTIDIGFNVTYLLDVLAHVKSEAITIALGDANSSALITTPDNAEFKYVVMPMRI
jgi:protein involved in polysaccharide export with SLBB domain